MTSQQRTLILAFALPSQRIDMHQQLRDRIVISLSYIIYVVVKLHLRWCKERLADNMGVEPFEADFYSDNAMRSRC